MFWFAALVLFFFSQGTNASIPLKIRFLILRRFWWRSSFYLRNDRDSPRSDKAHYGSSVFHTSAGCLFSSGPISSLSKRSPDVQHEGEELTQQQAVRKRFCFVGWWRRKKLQTICTMLEFRLSFYCTVTLAWIHSVQELRWNPSHASAITSRAQ